MGVDASAMLIGRKNGYENYVQAMLWEMTEPEVVPDDIELVFYFYAGNRLADPSLLSQILPRFQRFRHRVYRPSHLFGRVLPLFAAVDQLDYLHLPVHLWSNWYPCPVGITFHDACGARLLPESPSEGLETHERQVRKAIAVASAYVAVSEYSKRDLVDLYGVPAHAVSVAHHGSDPFFYPSAEDAQRARQTYNLDKYLLTVGALQTNKNHERLVEAYVRLRRERNIPHELILVGRDGHGANRILDAIGRAEEPVRRLGFVSREDLRGLYSAADLVVCPSLCEGFGLTLLEAMQCGAVVAASHATSLPEVGGDAAVWFNPCDIDSMMSAIWRGLTDRELRTNLLERGAVRAGQFSWRQAALDTIAVYRAWCSS